jgi:hypothetical protein
MHLTLYDIIKGILNESVSSDEVLDAIRNKKYVRIRYDDTKPPLKGIDKGDPKGSRVIMPMAYGTTKAGNPVVRAFQWNGNSRRGAPKWKFFRLDRITSWKPFRKQFTAPPDDLYNYTGDRSMGSFIDNSKFDFNTQGDIDAARQGDKLTAPKVSVRNTQGPISAAQQIKKNVYTSQPNSKKYNQYAKNIDQTEKKDDDYWKMFDLADAEKTLNQKGPVKTDSYEDEFDVDDIDFNNNDFDINNRRR